MNLLLLVCERQDDSEGLKELNLRTTARLRRVLAVIPIMKQIMRNSKNSIREPQLGYVEYE